MGQRQKRTGGHGTGGWLRWCAPLCALVAAAWGCPPDCACEQTTRSLTCWSLPWGRMPTWVRTLAVSGDHVPTLSSWGFASNQTQPALESLSLSHSSIETIEGNAFVGLSHLRSLDLSHNRLSVLSRHAFQGLSQLRHLCLNASLQESGATHLPEALGAVPNLRTLELSGNGLQNLPLDGVHAPHLETLVLTNNSLRTLGAEDVSWLMDRRGLRVFLAANPFACDCGLRSLHWWLRNASQCADAPRLDCAEPEARQGTPLETLRREDLVCLNPDLEAVSYVLLGIVLALIGVVFLMVLYLNRGGIKKWLNNIREACRDQMEVYHYRYEQDSDPRLASMAV